MVKFAKRFKLYIDREVYKHAFNNTKISYHNNVIINTMQHNATQ